MNRWKTIDGHQIVDGLRVWDYNLDRSIVDVAASRAESEYWNGWFEMRSPEGKRRSSMNGERMWVRHPTTGEKA